MKHTGSTKLSNFLRTPSFGVRAFGVRVLAVGALCLALAGCGGDPSEHTSAKVDPKYGVKPSPRLVGDGKRIPKGGGRYMVGKPYTIAGKRYYPKEQPNYKQRGKASWYGEAFHGRQTANGEIFDKQSLTAAHTTLPLPSYVKVTNLSNGRSMTVRVNDRGPFHGNRIIDVSERVAELLGFKHDGIGNVKVEYVDRASTEGSDERMLLASLSGPDIPRRRTLFARANTGRDAGSTRRYAVNRPSNNRPAQVPPTRVGARGAATEPPVAADRPAQRPQSSPVQVAYEAGAVTRQTLDPPQPQRVVADNRTPTRQPTFGDILRGDRNSLSNSALSLQGPATTTEPFPLLIGNQSLDAIYYGTEAPTAAPAKRAKTTGVTRPPAPLSFGPPNRVSQAFEAFDALFSREQNTAAARSKVRNRDVGR